MSELEERLWREAQIAAKNWLNNLGGGTVQSLNSYYNPQANSEALRVRTINEYNWRVEEHNRRIRGE
jgi:hypothetical protein